MSANLHSAEAGDLLFDEGGRQYRVQKNVGTGLRLRSIDGARDYRWDQLEALRLRLDPNAHQGNRAARRLSELRKECELEGIDTSSLLTTSDYERALWDNPEWIAEEKLDGVRIKLHIGAKGSRVDSRRRDTKTRRFSEKSANFPHVLSLAIPELEGTVLDCEGFIPDQPLKIATSTSNAGPDKAREIQDRLGQMHFVAFDVLRINQKDVTGLTWKERRELLDKVVKIIHDLRISTFSWLRTSDWANVDKLSFFENLIADGGEGVMLKREGHRYHQGKRTKDWMKLKRFQEVDAYVTGWKPGEAGNTGLVGALELSVILDGKPHRGC
jgi:bifunctional non-homologous end joining protein LigD